MTIREYNRLKSRMFSYLEDGMREAFIFNKKRVAWSSMTCRDGSWIDIFSKCPDYVEVQVHHMRENEDNAVRGDDAANPRICEDIRNTMPTWAEVEDDLHNG